MCLCVCLCVHLCLCVCLEDAGSHIDMIQKIHLRGRGGSTNEDKGRWIDVCFHLQQLGEIFAEVGGEVVGETGQDKSCDGVDENKADIMGYERVRCLSV